MKRSRINLACEVCGKEYETHTYRANTSHYCSKGCWSHRSVINATECLFCGETFIPKESGQQFCSFECSKKFRIGVNAPRWKDGKSLERQRARLGTELKAWRTAVYIRDNYTCQQCGAKGKIHAHHIKPWAEYEESRFDVSNGITLCIDCHSKIHNVDFANQRMRICPDCGKKMTGRGKRCHPCAMAHFHHQSGHKQPRTCPQCEKDFIPRNHTRIYCSRECAMQARRASKPHITRKGRVIEKPVIVRCSKCDKEIKRQSCQIKNSKTGRFFCSEDCRHAYDRKRILTICPICDKAFEVMSYRLRDGKQVTCSRDCGYKHIRLQRSLARSQLTQVLVQSQQ